MDRFVPENERLARSDARKALARLCDLHGFVEAAEVLRAECDGGLVTLSAQLANTRDGREDAIAALQEAFEAERHPIIVIGRVGPVE